MGSAVPVWFRSRSPGPPDGRSPDPPTPTPTTNYDPGLGPATTPSPGAYHELRCRPRPRSRTHTTRPPNPAPTSDSEPDPNHEPGLGPDPVLVPLCPDMSLSNLTRERRLIYNRPFLGRGRITGSDLACLLDITHAQRDGWMSLVSFALRRPIS